MNNILLDEIIKHFKLKIFKGTNEGIIFKTKEFKGCASCMHNCGGNCKYEIFYDGASIKSYGALLEKNGICYTIINFTETGANIVFKDLNGFYHCALYSEALNVINIYPFEVINEVGFDNISTLQSEMCLDASPGLFKALENYYKNNMELKRV